MPLELFKTISNEPPLSTNSAWIPKPNSKIFVCNPRHLGLNEADLKYIEFFSFEAVLLDADHLQLWSNDQRTRFLAVTFKYKLRLILQFDVGDLGKPKFQDFIVQMKPHLSIRIKNLEDLKNDFHDFMISYFSLQLTEATNLTEFQKLEFKFSGIPIFVEIACAQDSNKSMQSLNLAQAHYNFFETYGDLPSIFSTEKMEAFENGDIYWNLSP